MQRHVEWFLYHTGVIVTYRDKKQPAVPIQKSNQVTFAVQLAFTGLLPMPESSSCQSTVLFLLQPFIAANS